MLRILAVSLVGLGPVTCHAQTSPAAGAPEGWSQVQALPRGTLVHVGADHGGRCRIATVDDTALHCAPEGTTGRSFAREQIHSVKLSRRGTSAVAMAAIGAGVGVATTAIVSKAGGLGGSAKAGVWAGSAGLGALIFAPIGYFGDTFSGPVIYRAPKPKHAASP